MNSGKRKILVYIYFFIHFFFLEEYLRHITTHQNNTLFTTKHTALNRAIVIYNKILNIDANPATLLEEPYFSDIVAILTNHRINESRYFKVSGNFFNIILNIYMKKLSFFLNLGVLVVNFNVAIDEEFTTIKAVPLRTPNEYVYLGTNLNTMTRNILITLINRFDDILDRGSGML